MSSKKEMLVEKMVSRRVRHGNRADESRALLSELVAKVSAQNLSAALVYNNFATEASADNLAVQLSGKQLTG